MKPLTIKNKTFGGRMPNICIPITGRNKEEILDTAKKIAAMPHDMAEWRADYDEAVTDHGHVLSVLAALREILPETLLLFTFRTKKEGGVRELSLDAYLDLCQAVAKSGLVDFLDFELFTGTESIDSSPLSAPLISLAHAHECRIILSNHDFEKTPPGEELFRRLSLMAAAGADIAKLAVMPHNEQDVLNLLCATRQAADTLNCPVATMSMGALGVVSRISGSLTGSCITFGTAGEASAPGQLPAKILKKILESL